MSSAMAQKIDSNEPVLKRSLIAYGVSDETFAIASSKMKHHIPTAYIAGLQGLLFFSFNLGTILGTFIINDINPRITQSLGITIYAMFLSILIPNVKKSNKVLRIVIIAVSISSFLTFQPWIVLSMGWILISATVITAMTMAYLEMKMEKEIENG
jgi:predicted branched-subunit amino acid permease